MPYQYGFITPGAGAGAQLPQMPASGADPLDAFISSQGGLTQSGGRSSKNTAATPPANAADPLDTFIASQGGLPKPTAPAAHSTSSGLAQDLAAGGASPDTWSNLQQIGSGAWHGISSLASNAANLVEKGIAAGANAIPGVRGSTVGNWLTNTANSDVGAQIAADRQFRQSASPGTQASAIVAPMLLPMGGALRVGNVIRDGISALPAMGGTVGRMVGAGIGNAATGAALSAGTAIDPNQPYWPQVGRNAAVGAGMGVAAPAIIGGLLGAGRAAYNAAMPLLNPRGYVGQQFADAIGNDAAQVATNIRNAPVYVPGSMPTTAQVGATPFLAQTEKAMANSNPAFKTALEQRNIDNNDARWGALMGVAGTPADLQAAQAAREAAATPLYQSAHQATANVGPAFMRYAQIPEMQEAMQRANQIASLDAAVGRGVAPVWPLEGGSRQINGAALDYTSRALGDMINEAQRQGTSTRVGALTALKSDVDNWMTRYVPGVQQARAAYAAGSVPINTMQVGQQIANGLGTRSMNAGQVPQIQLMPYRSALTRAMSGADFGIDANALNTLQGIGQDLQRATVSNSIRSPGSDTAYNLATNGWLARQLYGRNFQGGAVGSVLGNAAQAAGAAGGAAFFGPAGAGVGSALGSGIGGLLNGSRVGTRLNGQLAGLLLNPQEFLPYLDARAVGAPAPVTGGLMQGLSGRLQYMPALAVPQLAGPQGNL
ncbi:hypothetical protein H3O04_02175 [Burkholderia sp. KCJ3K979]|uniref:hypothetical protein n=1 Tax=Burkholderia sp. KCJ3K979 TaxID=2759149 RepID=UPI0019298887|nr:hypothetical protein [Burkholderia sp. KCJ3K979]MBL3961301.1 hypothetical protein [Burkholderia sp. KCJ3K979]